MKCKAMSAEQYDALPAAARKKVPQGRPCPVCEQIIEMEWVEHTFVELTCPQCAGKTRFGAGARHAKMPAGDSTQRAPELRCGQCGHAVPYPDYEGNTRVMGDCPHCGRDYMMEPGQCKQ